MFLVDWYGCFDFVLMYYFLYCLSGEMIIKVKVIKNVGMVFKFGGIFFGVMILGKEVFYNVFGKKLMVVYNKKGIFSNINDLVDMLCSVLDEYFVKVILE